MTDTARRRAELGLTQPLPASFGLSRIGGLLGKLIAAGQAFSGDGSRFTHAFLVVEVDGELKALEAMPGGARIVPLADRLNDPEVVFCDGPIQGYLATSESRLEGPKVLALLEHEIRAHVVRQARPLERVRYGYLQYLYLGLLALTSGKDGSFTRWLSRRISQKGSMICSQLVDEAYRRAGIQIFDDGRLSQEVTPGDLANRFGLT